MSNRLAKFSLFLIAILVSTIGQSQLTHNRFAFKIYIGSSSSRVTLKEDNLVRNGPVCTISPEFSYNRITKKGNLLEVGLRIFVCGSKLTYEKNPYTDGRILTKVGNLSLSFIFHKKLCIRSNRLYLGIGGMLGYSLSPMGVSFDDTLAYVANEIKIGLKINLLLRTRYVFKIKNRNLGLDLSYSKGFMNFYETSTLNHFTDCKNHYVNKGSGVNLGLIYFFGARTRQEKARIKIEKRLRKAIP
jgi:hypothetical protein